jgi:hypothetical protein
LVQRETLLTMSTGDEYDGAAEQELTLDLWQGQFEFVGEDYGGHGLGDGGGGGGGVIHVTSPPRLGSNGVKKTEAYLWCEDLTEQVSQANVKCA